jgi:hypothetical protein
VDATTTVSIQNILVIPRNSLFCLNLRMNTSIRRTSTDSGNLSTLETLKSQIWNISKFGIIIIIIIIKNKYKK